MAFQPKIVTAMPPTELTKKAATALAKQEVTAWDQSTVKQRSTANSRATLISSVITEIEGGITANMAAKHLLARIKAGKITEAEHNAVLALGKNGKPPSLASIKRWVKDYNEQGREGLLPAHTGRVRQDYGWEAEAVRMYNIPSKPGFSDVAFRLRGLGWETAKDHLVARYLKALPATLGKDGKKRVGAHFYQQNKTPHIQRDKSVLLVGEVYQGDGHTVDVYLAHPSNGTPYRPELTVWIDVRSRYIAGWYLSESESSHSTLFALSHAMISNDHVPATLYIDNGAGFKSKLMNDPSTGFYSRFDLSTIFALPGHSRSKGDVEGWFRIFRDKHDKFWNDGKDYCGNDQSQDTNLKLSTHVRSGKRKLLTVDQYKYSVGQFIEAYNNEPSKTALNGKSPAELWATLDRVPVELTDQAVIRPRITRMVRKWTVKFGNRTYKSDVLMDYDGASVAVEYDLHDDSLVWIYDSKDRLICKAELIDKVAYLPQSRLEEQRDKRLKGQTKRLQKKLDEAVEQRRDPLDSEYTSQLALIQSNDSTTEQIEKTPLEIFDIDITDWSNDDE